MAPTIFLGSFIHCQPDDLKALDICEKGAIGVNNKGVIEFVERDIAVIKDVLERQTDEQWQDATVVQAKEGSFFFPGFIDTHIHASQYPNAGIFGNSTLLDWLNTYTFPLESSLSDLSKARTVYTRAVARGLSHGTTTAAYYATLHVASTNLLADICLKRGQRAFVGRCCMDHPEINPDYYRDESAQQSLDNTIATIDYIKTIDPRYELVSPIITPRFAPSCTSELLDKLGKLSYQTGLPCQTHISENVGEVELVKSLFPQASSYAHVYDAHGLLSTRMILAHAIHLSPSERNLIKIRGAKISHCPASNSALTSGGAKVRELLNEGIDVGLGTDVSGGYSISMLEAVRQATLVSRHVAMTDGEEAKLTVEEALWLATRGGAKVVNLDDKIGGFELGKEFDAQMIGLTVVDDAYGEEEGWAIGDAEGPVDVFGWENWNEKVAKWVYNGDDRNTKGVWVKGRLVWGSA